jgi:hypothetical protein
VASPGDTISCFLKNLEVSKMLWPEPQKPVVGGVKREFLPGTINSRGISGGWKRDRRCPLWCERGGHVWRPLSATGREWTSGQNQEQMKSRQALAG